jgi:hypothetical protein
MAEREGIEKTKSHGTFYYHGLGLIEELKGSGDDGDDGDDYSI